MIVTSLPLGVVHVTDPAAFTRRLCGLSVASRALAGLGRVCERVYLVGPIDPAWRQSVQDELAPMPRQPQVEWDAPVPTGHELIWVDGPVVFDARLFDAGDDRDVSVAWLRPAAPAGVWRIPASESAAMVAVGGPRASGLTFAVRDPAAGLCDVVTSATDVAAVEAKLLHQGRKESDTWVARTLDRPISLFLTRRLLPLPVTPNQITIVSTLVGLAGAVLLGLGTYLSQLLGGVLLTASVIIDGCDGEVARIKFMESDFGRKLDFFLDNVVNVAAIFAVGAGYAHAGGSSWYLYASLINAAAAAAAVWPVYSLFFRQNKEAVRLDRQPPASGVRRIRPADLVEGIAGRDFAYIVLILAVFGRAHWFTLLCLVGILFFLAAVVVLWLAQRWLQSPTGDDLAT